MSQIEGHTFAICAYGESPYLEACIRSVLRQSVEGQVIIVSSTPNTHIRDLAERYQISLYCNEAGGTIDKDWNYAVEKANTNLVTIAHQDDVYLKEYRERILEYYAKAKRPLIIFTDYGELRGRKTVTKNKLLNIKRALLFPLRSRLLWSSKWVRRRILSIASSISCPTITYVKPNIPLPLFKSGFRSNLDWQAEEEMSRMDGSFVYCPRVSMLHRIHDESTTSKLIQSNGRIEEDYLMFKRFWPEPIARLINRVYNKAEGSNTV